MSDVIEQFKQDLATVSWKDLRIHLQRDAIIIVEPGLDLLEVAVAVAEDNKLKVAAWIAGGELQKPTDEQLECWETLLDKPFQVLIVQPFILIQDAADA